MTDKTALELARRLENMCDQIGHPDYSLAKFVHGVREVARALLSQPQVPEGIKHRTDFQHSLIEQDAETAAKGMVMDVLRGLTRRHEWQEGLGPCVCEWHIKARELLSAAPEAQQGKK